MAPDLPNRIVGIRPGEKLHEVMITEDDARTTVELDDRFVIEPALAWWSFAGYKERGAPVAEGFRYGSDTNTKWLSPDELHAIVARC
jgi:UDP-N-acetylglucosamine 4,6-dehydratase